MFEILNYVKKIHDFISLISCTKKNTDILIEKNDELFKLHILFD